MKNKKEQTTKEILTNLNKILKLSQKRLSKFSDDLFKIANETNQSFKSVSDAAIKFFRNGLSIEEGLKRTKDVLILTRLSGLKPAESVKEITKAIDSFNGSPLGSAKVLNKLTKKKK